MRWNRRGPDAITLVLRTVCCSNAAAALRRKDLNDVVCLKRVISVMAEQTDVEEVVLSGDWESLYREGCVRVLNAYAELVRACRSSSLMTSGGEQCQTCPNDPRKLAGRHRRSGPDALGRPAPPGQLRQRTSWLLRLRRLHRIRHDPLGIHDEGYRPDRGQGSLPHCGGFGMMPRIIADRSCPPSQ